jgi:glycosidase
MESGADSPFRDWFYLSDDVLGGRSGVHAYALPRGGPAAERGYRSWWDVPALPKLRVENPHVREMLMSVAEHWIRFGADGWRLDVPQDIEDDTFWPEFRRRVRAVNPDAYLLGEIWDEGPEWLRGDRFDALMNYPLAVAILGFVGGPALDRDVIAGQSNYARAVVALDGPDFGAAVERQLSLYDPAVTAVQYNLIGSHDTPRARSVMGGSAELLRLAILLQMVLPGAPAIYYGDEIAMAGAADPDCRRAYPERGTPLPADATATRAFVQAAIRARREHAPLRSGEMSVVLAGPRWIVFERRADGNRAIVAVNAGDAPVIVSGAELAGLRPVELPWATVAAGGIQGSGLASGSGLVLPAQSGIVLVD